MSNTRDLILRELLNRRRCTINELATAVGINPISVRHHIARLEADNLVASKSERHGVGRPRQVYSLTEEGMEKFPTRYLDLSMRLMEGLKESLPADKVRQLFEDIASGLARELVGPDMAETLTFAERLELVRKILSQQGFTVEIEENEGLFSIRETSCPYIHVGQEHPEVCLVDQTLIATVLATSVKKTHCVLDGDTYCSYSASAIPADNITIMESSL